jgi:hypothetical protein
VISITKVAAHSLFVSIPQDGVDQRTQRSQIGPPSPPIGLNVAKARIFANLLLAASETLALRYRLTVSINPKESCFW